MLNELSRYNNIGDVNGIIYLLRLVLADNRTQKSSAQKLCALNSNIRINFPASILLFKYLGLIEEKVGYLYPTEQGKDLTKAARIEKAFCSLCFKKTMDQRILDTSTIHYSVNKGEYTIERHGFLVSAALFRNILLQFQALKEDAGNLIIAPEYEKIFIEFQKKRKIEISLEEFKKKLEIQEEQGERAEKYVLKYEKERLQGHSNADRIKHISVIDVTAGYDILSYDSVSSENLDRFIEVKSYAGNPHFYWSQNEIEKAKLYADKYYIYMIDALKMSDNGYEPRIIKNPASVILNSGKWIINPTSYMVIPME